VIYCELCYIVIVKRKVLCIVSRSPFVTEVTELPLRYRKGVGNNLNNDMKVFMWLLIQTQVFLQSFIEKYNNMCLNLYYGKCSSRTVYILFYGPIATQCLKMYTNHLFTPDGHNNQIGHPMRSEDQPLIQWPIIII